MIANQPRMQQMGATIRVADDFSRFPGGRHRKYGPHSGEEFRERLLLPALNALAGKGSVNIDLSRVVTYPPSFLDEAFAALVRDGHLAPEEFFERIVFTSDDANKPYITQIRKYVNEAHELKHSSLV